MSKFTGRMNRLFLKTHVFISYADLCFVRDYYMARFEESEKPDDFDERYKELLKLQETYSEISKKDYLEEVSKLINDNPSVWFKARHLMFVEISEDHPRGLLVDKKTGEIILKNISDAKMYFK